MGTLLFISYLGLSERFIPHNNLALFEGIVLYSNK